MNNMRYYQSDNEEKKDNQEYIKYNNEVTENINEENETFNQPINTNSRQIKEICAQDNQIGNSKILLIYNEPRDK